MTVVSWTERAVLSAILAVSVAWFARRLNKVLDIVRRSRPTSDFELTPIGPRIRQFVWEVVLQGKVIVDRPLAGIAHAFVFWGFCAFGLVTLNHIATGFGLRLVPPDSVFG